MDDELLRLGTWQLALAEGSPGSLLRLDEDAAWITVPKLGAVMLTTATEPERLVALATDFRARATNKATLVVLGGGLDVRQQLQEDPPVPVALPSGFSVGRPKGIALVHVDHWGRSTPGQDGPLAVLDPRKPDIPEGQFRAAVETALSEARALSRWQETMQRRKPWGTYGLCVAILLVYGLVTLSGGTELSVLVRSGGLTSDVLFRGELWQLASASFVHGNLLHVGFAVAVLWMLGGFLERLIGTSRFLVLYFLSALGGTFFAVPSALLGATVVGSSTALWGILVAHFVLSRRPRGLLPESLIPQARRVATINLLLNFAVSFLPGVSLLGHLGGGIVGWMLFMPGLMQWGLTAKVETPISKRVFGTLAAGLAGLFASALTIALWTGQPWQLAGEPTLEPREVAEGLTLDLPSYLEVDGQQHGRVPFDPVSVKAVEHRPADPAAFAESWQRLHPEDHVIVHPDRVVTVRVESVPEAELGWLYSQLPGFEAEQGASPQ